MFRNFWSWLILNKGRALDGAATDLTEALDDLVVSDPEIRGGMLVLRGTRIGVYEAADLARHDTRESILEGFPSLTDELIDAAVEFVRRNPRDDADRSRNKTFMFSDRAAEKQRSREEDERRIKAGEITPSELRRENAFIKGGGFASKKIGFSSRARPKGGPKYYRADGSIDRVQDDSTNEDREE